MPEEHVSVSAVGRHFDEEVEIAALAQRFYEEEGRPEGRSLEHWRRAEKEIHQRKLTAQESEPHPTPEDQRVEEAMHLGQ